MSFINETDEPGFLNTQLVHAAMTSTGVRRGAFILFEGIDRCGKTTQSNALATTLSSSGIPVQQMRFPDRTTSIGTMIDGYLREVTDLDDKAVHLLFAANRWEAAAKIEKTLAEGTTLIVDRYSYSGMVFTAAKGYDMQWCFSSEVGLPKPDAVIYMDLTVDEALTRGGFGNERYEKEAFQRTVADLFVTLADNDPETWFKCDAARKKEDITKELVAYVREIVNEIGGNPLARICNERLTLI